MEFTRNIGPIIAAARRIPELQLPPAEALLDNRLRPFLQEAWDAASKGDFSTFAEVLRGVYLEGMMDGDLPLAILLTVAIGEVGDA
ncbi:hypothetical protein KZX47_08945 [Thermus sp. SYSU G05001]|uniref:Uncharacterized protein n=1 Tax=Thermus brevis TaxID=2862456 RepID=A0ABS6ZYY0_9DEIN|nr:hypothetical protein [Thermus brevis]MBW6395272.1 hypothetical protein [Thermus brevis]